MAAARGRTRGSTTAADEQNHFGILELTSADVKFLARSKSLVHDVVGPLVDELYDRLLAQPEFQPLALNPDDLERSKSEYSAYFLSLFRGEEYAHAADNSEFVHGLDTRYYLTALPLIVDLFASRALDHPTLTPASLPELVNALSTKLWADALIAVNSYASHKEELIAVVETESRRWRGQVATESRVLARISEVIQTSPQFDSSTIDAVAEAVSELLEFDRFSISRIDSETGELIVGPSSGVKTFDIGHRIPIDVGAIERDFNSNNVRVYGDADLAEAGKIFPVANDLRKLGFKSVMAVTLRWQGNLLGFVSFLSYQPKSYGGNHKAIASRLGSPISAALVAADRIELLEQQVVVDDIVFELVQSVTSQSSVEPGLENFSRHLTELFDIDRAVVSTYLTGSNYPHQGAGYDRRLPKNEIAIPDHRIPESLIKVLINPSPTLLGLPELEEFARTYEPIAVRLENGLVSLATVGLTWQEQPVGWIALWSGREEAFTSSSLKLLRQIGERVAGSIGYVQLNQQQESDFREQTAISEMATAISSAESAEASFENFTRLLHEFYASARAGIAIFDAPAWTVTDIYSFDSANGHRHIGGMNLAVPSEVVTEPGEHSAIVINREILEQYAPVFPPYVDRLAEGIEEGITVPLWWQGDAVGSLSIFVEDKSTLGEYDMRLLERIATHVSGAIGYLLLNRGLERSLKQQSVLAQIGQIVGSALDIEEVFEEVVPVLGQLIDFDELGITTVDIEAGTLSVLYNSNLKDRDFDPNALRPLEGTATALVLASERPIHVTVGPDGEGRAGFPSVIDSNPHGIKSAVGAPLISDGVMFGALMFRSKTDAAFDTVSDELLLQVSAQFSGAIAYHGVNERLSGELREQTALAHISQIIGSELDLKTAFDEIAETLRELVPFDSIFASTFDLEAETRTNVYLSSGGFTLAEIGLTRPYAGAISGAIVERQIPLRIDLEEDGSWPYGEPLERAIARGEKSIAALPLISDGKLFGAFEFHSVQPNAYDELTDEFLERLAAHLAAAIAYNQVNEKLQVELNEQTTLAQIGQILSANSDIGMIFDDIADVLKKLIDFDTMLVNVVEHETATRLVRYASGHHTETTEIGARRPLKGSLTEMIIEGRKTVRSIKHEKDADEGSVVLPDMKGGFNTGIAVPLVSQGEVLGALQLLSFKTNVYPKSQVRFLTLVAEQFSGAMARAELMENQLILVLERERAEELESQNQELVQIQRTREHFLEMITHELRTPLTSISAFTDILGRDREGTLTKRQSQQLDAVSRNASQLAELIDDLIHMSRMERGQSELVLGQVDLVELVRRVCESMAHVIQHRDQKLITNLEVAKLRLDLDHSRMTQVLNNLISNASKFSPSGSTITVSMQLLGTDIQIEVSDEGPGIKPDEVKSVFDPFYRIDNEATKLVPGTGLGLYVARTIVRQHGGDITVAQTESKGTTLRIVIPLEHQPRATT